MYFHLIWIKEKNWNKFDLDLLLQWWDENFIRGFLSNRWVVIVSLSEFKEDPLKFWNIIVNIDYSWSNIQLTIKWEDLSESTLFIISLWLNPVSINYSDNPIPEEQVKDIINTALSKVKEEDKKAKEQAEMEELKEKKKYEESWIEDWLKIINSNIDRIEQVVKAGKWVISWIEIKKLEDYGNEMKKIRLWTNFNKMAALVIDAQVLLEEAEKQIFAANEQNKFLINENSVVTNIDVLQEYLDYSMISEKTKLQSAWLSTNEMIVSTLWENSIFLNLLKRDILHSFENSSFGEFVDIIVDLLEFIILLIIITISLSWLIGSLIWVGNYSLYLLPAMWRLWLLIYLFDNIELKWAITRIVWFVVLVLVYRKWLVLLLNTFAL